MILLSTAYFPNVQYFSKLENYKDVFIEQHENYEKKTFRNRCEILSANGKLSLSVPVEKTGNQKMKITEVKIDYSENWQKNHLKALEASYNLSPFYEFYIDDLLPLFENKFEYLFEHNNEILKTVNKIIGIKTNIKFTKNFIKPTEDTTDFRFSIHPKEKMQKIDTDFVANKYIQTFSDKFEFIPNLSILDLIFNLGPASLEYLHKTKINRVC